jgi:HCOMODA/2-hydroxy-3-carboxy-muconic semialdehyde decarboxylase
MVLLTVGLRQPNAAPQAPSAGAVPETDEQRIADLVTANHILFDQGVVDAYGHVSVRSVKNPKHYFLSRSQAPGLVTKDDIVEFDENSSAIDQRGRPIYSERFIHGEILRAHPDAQAVVHGHSPAVIPFGVTGVPLRPLIHMAGFLGQTTPVFEIRQASGPDNGMLVQDIETGSALAKSLGASPVVLMRGHGMAVVGPSVRHAVFRAIYTQLNAQVQMDAMRLGTPIFMNATEARKVDEVNEGSLLTTNPRQWLLWAAQADAHAAGLNK